MAKLSGVARCEVRVRLIGPNHWEVAKAVGGERIAEIKRARGPRGNCYSFKLVGWNRSHSGFSTRKAAVKKILEKA